MTLVFRSFLTNLAISCGILDLMTLHSFLFMANWARVWATWLPSRCIWMKPHLGKSWLNSLISVMIPSQLALLGCEDRRALMSVRQSDSTNRGCLTHSATVRRPSSHARASASSGKVTFSRNLQADSITVPRWSRTMTPHQACPCVLTEPCIQI